MCDDVVGGGVGDEEHEKLANEVALSFRSEASVDASDLFAGSGEVRAFARELDWSTSPLGPTTSWSPALRTMARSMFDSPFPICLWSGPQFALVYNDPYRRILAAKHPAALGQPGSIVWAEIWDELRPQFEGVRAGGDPVYFEDAPFVMARLEGGGTETAWFNYALSALRDEDGSIAAVLNITPETSGRVLLERRLGEEQAALALSEERFRALANASSDMIYRMSPDWKEMRHLDGRSILADTDAPSIAWMDEYLLPEDLAEIQAAIDRAIERKAPFELEHRVRQADGSIGWTFSRAIPMMDEAGKIIEWFGAATDATGLVSARKYRDALIDLTARFDGLTDPYEIGHVAAEVIGQTLDVSRVGYGTIDPITETLHVERDWTAPGVETLAGITPLRDYGSSIDSLKRGEFISIDDVDNDDRTAAAAAALKVRSSFSFMSVPVIEHGRLVAVLFVNHGAIRRWTDDERAFMREASARTHSAVERSRTGAALRELNATLQDRIDRALMEQAATEAALRQAQKMEAVGQLTGGLAHDFNNLLAGMMGNLELLQLRLAKGRFDDLDRFINAAQGAGRRAASLTQRLLAFSRRQTLDPRPIDVNRLISGLQEMLQRTVGASADIEIVGAAGLWTTNIDAAQLENAILNLCINGRDAMPEGGKLTIETANKWIDDRTAREREMAPGQYVAVCVTDIGTGMSEATIARAFEPFYTTKPIGQGTGLGLSMIYGFAKQSGGQVRIYSELGQGTTVCVYLPRHYGEATNIADADTGILTSSANAQTVLVVDDEATIRHVIDEALDDLGYTVIGAADGAAGIKVLQSGAKIDLLITDVGLPNGMNGRQVADAARVIRPGLKVLFITGFAENAAVGNGHLEPGMELLTKPFTLEALSMKVADMLRPVTT